MIKKVLLSLLLLILAGNIIWMIYILSFGKKHGASQNPFQTKDAIEIALVGPLTGDAMVNGRAMVRGAQMAIEAAEQSGLLKNRKIRLRPYDDQNNIKAAMKMASEISLENRAVAVLGHFAGETSEAAGKIYAKHAIPMITGSATPESVTQENIWAFSTVAGTDDQALSIISHVKTMDDRISVIYTDNNYGRSFLQAFKRIVPEVGIKIIHVWPVIQTKTGREGSLEKIINDIRSIEDPGVIVFATPSHTGATLISAFKNPGTHYRIVGTDTFSNELFFESLTQLPQERAQPGYFIDGIYACTPFLADLANPSAKSFITRYKERFLATPSWVTACYYDAMTTLLEAIDVAHVRGKRIREDRIQLRTALSQMNSPEEAVSGLTGPIFFNTSGRVERLVMMGTYEHQRFRPAFTQFNVVAGKKESVFKEHVGDNVTVFADKVLSQKQLVFVGVDINRIQNIDINHGRFFLDFYLWFRFKPPFNEQQIIFENSATSIELTNPLLETIRPDYTIRTYHIKALFNQRFSFDNFPFDQHTMSISFHHALQTDQKLIFIPDYLSLENSKGEVRQNYMSQDRSSGWQVRHLRASKNSFTKKIGPISLTFSRLNTYIDIARFDQGFALKILLPLMMLLLMVAVAILFSIKSPRVGLLYIVCGVTLSAYCHYYFGHIFPATNTMKGEYTFYAIYLLGGMLVLLFGSIALCRKRGWQRGMGHLQRLGALISFFCVIGILAMNIVSSQ